MYFHNDISIVKDRAYMICALLAGRKIVNMKRMNSYGGVVWMYACVSVSARSSNEYVHH